MSPRGRYDDYMRYIPVSRLICNEKDRFLPDVAMADDLHENGNIAGSPEYPTDRIRNAGVGRIDHKQAG